MELEQLLKNTYQLIISHYQSIQPEPLKYTGILQTFGIPITDHGLNRYLLTTLVKQQSLTFKIGDNQSTCDQTELSRILNDYFNAKDNGLTIDERVLDQITVNLTNLHQKSQIEAQNDSLILEQFYKREENTILFNLYNILCTYAAHKDLVYSEICKKYNDIYAQSKAKKPANLNIQTTQKLTTLDVAHYCKKLEKCGFIKSQSNISSSEKKISLSKREQIKKSLSQYGGIDFGFQSGLDTAKADDGAGVRSGKNSKRKREEQGSAAKRDIIVANENEVKKDEIVDKSEQQIDEIRQNAIKRQKLIHQTFIEPKLTMRESIIRVLENKIDTNLFKSQDNNIVCGDDSESENENNNDQQQEKPYPLNHGMNEYEHLQQRDGKYTISDISVALGMTKEEKTMSRVLAELKKVHRGIESSAVRNGRVFQYKYFLKGVQQQQLQQTKLKFQGERDSNLTGRVSGMRRRDIKEEEKEIKSLDKLQNNGQQSDQVQIQTETSAQPCQNTIIQFLKASPQINISPQQSNVLLELNKKSFDMIFKIQANKNVLKPGQINNEIIMEYFQEIIQEGKTSLSRRQLTVETINRYIFCLNKVIHQGHISLVDLRNDIKHQLERHKGFEIDKKTLKRIVEKLKKDNLVKTVDFLVNIQQADGHGQQNMVKTLVLDVDFDEKSSVLMENPSISNPTNRQQLQQAQEDGVSMIGCGKGSSYKQQNEQQAQIRSSYSLRTRKQVVKYKDESGDESMKARESKESSMDIPITDIIVDQQISKQEGLQEQIINSADENMEVNKPEENIGYIETLNVKGIALQKALINLHVQNQKKNLNKSFQKILEIATTNHKFNLSTVFQISPQKGSLNFIQALASIAQLPTKKSQHHYEQPSLIDFNHLLNDPQLDDLIDNDLDQLTDVTLSKFTDNESTSNTYSHLAQNSSFNPKLHQKQDTQEIQAILLSLIDEEHQKTKKQKRQHNQYQFYDQESIMIKISSTCKQLSKIGRVSVQYIIKDYANIYNATQIIQMVCANGYAVLERDSGKVYIVPNSNINDLYSQVRQEIQNKNIEQELEMKQ
eukprot:403364481